MQDPSFEQRDVYGSVPDAELKQSAPDNMPAPAAPAKERSRFLERLEALLTPVVRKLLTFSVYIEVTLLIVFLFCAVVPYEMDEFIHYHPLLCHYYPGNLLNTFRGGCSIYDLNVLNTGIILPLRSFYYSGSFPALYYLPLFLLWRSPISARWMGLLFILIQSVLLSKLYKRRLPAVFASLLVFFPYLFQHMVDTGPVAYQITTVYLSAYLFRRWHEKGSNLAAVTAGLILFLGLWTKLTELWLLPGIGVLFVFSFLEHKGNLLDLRPAVQWLSGLFQLPPPGLPPLQRGSATEPAVSAPRSRFMAQLVLFLCTFIALSGVLLLSTSPSDPAVHPLIKQLNDSEHREIPEIDDEFWSIPIVRAFVNPLEATQRIYQVTAPGSLAYAYDAFIYLGPLMLLFLAMLRRPRRWGRIVRGLILYVAFLLTAAIVLATKQSWAMHHAILSFPFLILCAFEGLECFRVEKKPHWIEGLARKAFVVAYILLNAAWFLLFPIQHVQIFNDGSKTTVNHLLQNPVLAERYFYVVLDWGMYYYQGLYGADGQSVLYMRELRDKSQIQSLKTLADEHKRKLLFILDSKESSSDLGLIRTSFNLVRCEAIGEQAVWQVILEKDTGPGNPCLEAPSGYMKFLQKFLQM